MAEEQVGKVCQNSEAIYMLYCKSEIPFFFLLSSAKRTQNALTTVNFAFPIKFL